MDDIFVAVVATGIAIERGPAPKGALTVFPGAVWKLERIRRQLKYAAGRGGVYCLPAGDAVAVVACLIFGRECETPEMLAALGAIDWEF